MQFLSNILSAGNSSNQQHETQQQHINNQQQQTTHKNENKQIINNQLNKHQTTDSQFNTNDNQQIHNNNNIASELSKCNQDHINIINGIEILSRIHCGGCGEEAALTYIKTCGINWETRHILPKCRECRKSLKLEGKAYYCWNSGNDAHHIRKINDSQFICIECGAGESGKDTNNAPTLDGNNNNNKNIHRKPSRPPIKLCEVGRKTNNFNVDDNKIKDGMVKDKQFNLNRPSKPPYKSSKTTVKLSGNKRNIEQIEEDNILFNNQIKPNKRRKLHAISHNADSHKLGHNNINNKQNNNINNNYDQTGNLKVVSSGSGGAKPVAVVNINHNREINKNHNNNDSKKIIGFKEMENNSIDKKIEPIGQVNGVLNNNGVSEPVACHTFDDNKENKEEDDNTVISAAFNDKGVLKQTPIGVEDKLGSCLENNIDGESIVCLECEKNCNLQELGLVKGENLLCYKQWFCDKCRTKWNKRNINKLKFKKKVQILFRVKTNFMSLSNFM